MVVGCSTVSCACMVSTGIGDTMLPNIGSVIIIKTRHMHCKVTTGIMTAARHKHCDSGDSDIADMMQT